MQLQKYNNDTTGLEIPENNLNTIAQLATASALAGSTSFSLERQALSLYNNYNSTLRIRSKKFISTPILRWIEISQIGSPENQDFKSCFSALQNILNASAIPYSKTHFLITGKAGRFKMYIGLELESHFGVDDSQHAAEELSSFYNVSWKGLKTRVVTPEDENLREYFEKSRFSKAYAFTGIPSLDINTSNYPSTMEYLLGGYNPKGEIAYLVIAEPVEESKVERLIYQTDEMSGQAQSFEKFNLSESLQKGTNHTLSRNITETISKSVTDSTSSKNLGSALLGLGLGILGATAFGPAVAALALSEQMIGGMTMLGMGFINGLIPTKTHSETINTSRGVSNGESIGVSSSYTNSIGQTLVNGHIQNAIELIKAHGERFRKGKAKGMWRTGCYLMTDANNTSSHLQLKALLSGENSKLEPIRIHDISSILRENGYIQPLTKSPHLYIEDGNHPLPHPFGYEFSTLTTYLTTEELTSMINFPLHSVPGISVVTPPPQFRLDVPTIDNNKKCISLGHLMYAGDITNLPCQFPIDNLAKHALVCGVNGSGKTNSVLSILDAMNKNEQNFMVIEPAKTEYVDWAIKFNQQLEKDNAIGKRLEERPIVIYMPGKDCYWYCGKDNKSKEYILKDILKLNPFEPVCLEGQKPNVQAHMDRIKSIFALAFPMEDILPIVMESLIRDVYTNCEPWLGRRKDTPEPELFPTLGLLSCRIKPVVSSLGYEQRVTSNIYAALNLRIGNLLAGWKRELLNNEVLGGYKELSQKEKENGARRPTWHDFFNRRVVINLSGVSDESDRTFVMGLLLLYLYEYRIALSESKDFHFNHNKLRHLMVIEEAHRVMTNNPNPESAQYKCGVLFSNLLSEIRAYGQGIMVVDQIPTRLIPDAIKNTNIKIIHRTLAADDVEILSNAMGISHDQRKIIPKLSVGQAIVAGINGGNVSNKSEEDIFWTKINQIKE